MIKIAASAVTYGRSPATRYSRRISGVQLDATVLAGVGELEDTSRALRRLGDSAAAVAPSDWENARDQHPGTVGERLAARGYGDWR